MGIDGSSLCRKGERDAALSAAAFVLRRSDRLPKVLGRRPDRLGVQP
jgi:hypothetical protein